MAQAPKKEGAVAPTERINIQYRDESGGQVQDVELPLRLMVVGDFKGKKDTSDAEDFVSIEDRKTVNIDKNNFDEVLKSQDVELKLDSVANVLDPNKKELSVQLNFRSMKDFEPENVVKQIPELQSLLELREALTELKGPLAQNAAFRKRLQALLEDEKERSSILEEIGLDPSML